MEQVIDGSGDGDGSGYGYGYGYGDGDGAGDEKNTEAYWAAVAGATPSAHGDVRRGDVVALWLSDKRGCPANGGSAEPAFVGQVQEVAGPLQLCRAGTLHATFRLDAWQGERLWVVALQGEVAIADQKLGALRRVILAEVPLGER